jgi:predicted transcriptional regulator
MKTTIYIPDDQMAALDAMAKREARPKAQLIREAIELYVTENAQPMPDAIGIFEDLEVDSTNVDDWLRANWRPE